MVSTKSHPFVEENVRSLPRGRPISHVDSLAAHQGRHVLTDDQIKTFRTLFAKYGAAWTDERVAEAAQNLVAAVDLVARLAAGREGKRSTLIRKD